MKKLYLFFLLTLLPLFFINCSSQKISVKNNVSNEAYPSWYINPPENTQKFIYAIGSGSNRKEALNASLNSAAATLNVSVSSNYQHKESSETVQGKERYTNSSNEDLQINVNTVDFNEYKILQHQQRHDGQYIILISINKKQLYETMLHKIENSFLMLGIKLQNKNHDLEKILIYRQWLSSIESELDKTSLLHTLNPKFNDQVFITQYKSNLAAYNNLIENKRFKLVVNETSRAYVDNIRYALLKDGLKLTNNAEYDYLINVSVYEKESLAVRRHVLYTLTTTITIGLRTKSSNKDMFFESFDLTSQSDESLEAARDANIKKLLQKISDRGIFNIN